MGNTKENASAGFLRIRGRHGSGGVGWGATLPAPWWTGLHVLTAVVVGAKLHGNFARFINDSSTHSCVIDEMDHGVLVLIPIFTLRPILCGEELKFNHNKGNTARDTWCW